MNDDMILVTEVKIERSPRMEAVMLHAPKQSAWRGHGEMMSQAKWDKETVRGERYRTADGSIICIGLSVQARDALRLPLGVMQQQCDRIQELESRQAFLEAEWSKERRKAADITDRLGRLSAWERLRILCGADARRIVM